jgi:hypothetical protein
MKAIKRYKMAVNNNTPVLLENPNGNIVKYADIQDLIKEDKPKKKKSYFDTKENDND